LLPLLSLKDHSLFLRVIVASSTLMLVSFTSGFFLDFFFPSFPLPSELDSTIHTDHLPPTTHRWVW
jgi:hypothetical protein